MGDPSPHSQSAAQHPVPPASLQANTAKPGPHPDSQIDALAESMNAGTSKARMILALVAAFTVAYIAVIGVKVHRDRLGMVADARSRIIADAQIDAADMATRTSFVLGTVLGAASGLQTDWRRETTTQVRHLDALAQRPEIVAAGLFSSDGTSIVGSRNADAETLAQALKSRGSRGVWVALGPDGLPATLYAGADVSQENDVLTLIAQIDPRALTASGDRFFIIDATGASLIPGVGMPITNAQLFEQALSDKGMAATITMPDRPGQVLVGTAPIGQVGGAFVLRAEPLALTERDWQRTLMFYLLLLVAPLLVSVGLCAVWMMQLDNVRITRRKLIDSERRFRLAVEGARCGVWDWDLETDTIFITPSLARMLGRSQTKALQREAFLGLVAADDRTKLETAIRDASRIGHVDVEFSAANRPCSLHARGRPWAAADGERKSKSKRVVGVAIDVTEQRGAHSRVREAEGRLAAALNSITESFALWGPDNRLILSNPRFSEFFGVDEALSRSGASYEDFQMASAAAVRTYRPQNEPGLTEIELNDGRWLRVSDRRTGDGGIVSVGADITTLKNQEERLTDNDKHLRQTIKELGKTKERLEDARNQAALARTRAEEASRSKTEFLANMSHELRTPLNAIIGFAEIMQNQMFGPIGHERYVEYMKDIWTSAQHLLELISDILDMSRIEAGKMSLSYERVWPDELAEQCSRLIRPRAKAAELTYENNVGNMPEIMGDPRALKQVLLNLLSNAVKFTKAGGRIELTGRGDPAGVTFEVSDTGVGIAKNHLSRLGRPFEQIESHRAKTHQGSGLGLALSKTLSELHGGTLSIESELGVGTKVTVWIPRTPPTKLGGQTSDAP